MLTEILAHKQASLARIDQMQKIRVWEKEIHNLPAFRDFRGALVNRSGIALIAEVKRVSPSAGILKPDLDVDKLAAIYEESGASCISVLTEEEYFQGSMDDLKRVKACTGLPVLRKDFILTEYQVWESKIIGADCLLLIVALLKPAELKKLLNLTRKLGLQALLEVHTEKEVEQALKAGADMLGINNRDLRTLQVDLETTPRLLPLIPEDIVTVSESGLSSPEQISALQELGVEAVLVGEALLKSQDPSEKIRELLGKPLEIKNRT